VRRTFGRLVIAWLAGTALLVACGDDDPEGGARLPTRPDSTESDAGPTPEPEPVVRCDDSTTKVSDRPACDQCAKAKCCEEIHACEQSSACKALTVCIEACDEDDFVCLLTCQGSNPSGSALLSEIGYCAQAECNAECPSETPDAGFDAF
jgi:hypothetical protein